MGTHPGKDEYTSRESNSAIFIFASLLSGCYHYRKEFAPVRVDLFLKVYCLTKQT